MDWGIGEGCGSSIAASLPPVFESSPRKGVTTVLGCFVEDGRGAFADPLAFEEEDPLFKSGVETVRVAWNGREVYCECLSDKNTGVSELSSAVAEGVPSMLTDWLLSLFLPFLPLSGSPPSDTVHRPLPFGVRSRFGLKASLSSSEESIAETAIGEDVNSYIFAGDSFSTFCFLLNSIV